MNSMGASQRKKGLCLISAAVGFIILKKAVTVRPEQESPHLVTTVIG